MFHFDQKGKFDHPESTIVSHLHTFSPLIFTYIEFYNYRITHFTYYGDDV